MKKKKKKEDSFYFLVNLGFKIQSKKPIFILGSSGFMVRKHGILIVNFSFRKLINMFCLSL